MEILVSRNNFGKTYTTGAMFIDGTLKYVTLEDTDRGLVSSWPLEDIKDVKVFGRTAIPTGRYKIFKHYWAKHDRYAPMLLGVPGFEGILIHSGVTDNDTLGCILVGMKVFTGALQNSKAARIELDNIIFDCLDREEEVWITIQRINNANNKSS